MISARYSCTKLRRHDFPHAVADLEGVPVVRLNVGNCFNFMGKSVKNTGPVRC